MEKTDEDITVHQELENFDYNRSDGSISSRSQEPKQFADEINAEFIDTKDEPEHLLCSHSSSPNSLEEVRQAEFDDLVAKSNQGFEVKEVAGNGSEESEVGTDHETSDDEKEANEPGPSKSRRIVLSSDDEDNGEGIPSTQKSGNDSESEVDDTHSKVGVGELMTNIFGEDSDDEDDNEENSHSHYQDNKNAEDDDEPRYVRDEDDENYGREWDFDTMMREKKAERRKPRRRRRDGSIDVGGAYDDQIKVLIDAMKAAAKVSFACVSGAERSEDDRHSNMERLPALQKRKMLSSVKAMLLKHDLMEAVIGELVIVNVIWPYNGMMNVISEWLAPLPDKSLPALEIRTDLLKILQDFSRLEPGTLKQSGLGRAVMLLYKHPRETKENKALAARLISDWARPIFQLDTDFRSMTKDERIKRDYEQLPEAKRRRLNAGSESSDAEKETSEPRPGDRGFIMRARVPRPSQKDYVVRPKSNVEGQFRGATKNRANSRFDRTQREFKERTKQQRNERAVAVSINRVNL
ncbi:unnamed protein product [Thelazia callipaeda]|uniref:TFIIS N-terminal domain-containing protein n=1 Tax=Thelazia callipaeda TaxID=103827 RepID=A0A158RC11_THECL|nr:unnamed protein product [Thelazia callipaeda]